MARCRERPSGTGQRAPFGDRSVFSGSLPLVEAHKGTRKGARFFCEELDLARCPSVALGADGSKGFYPSSRCKTRGYPTAYSREFEGLSDFGFFRITAQIVLFEGAEHETNSVEFAASLTATPIGMRGLVSIRIDRDYHCVECAGVKGWVELTPRRNAHSSIAAIPSIRYGYRG